MNQMSVNFISAGIGVSLTYAFGGWTELFSILLMTMAIDYISGVAAALKEKTGLNSNIGFWGLTKKGFMLLIIMLAHRIDIFLGSDSITMSGAIYFYLANELISIIENYGRLGLPLPYQIKQFIQILNNKSSQPDTKEQPNN